MHGVFCVLLFGILYLAILSHMNILQLHLWMVYSYCSDRSTKISLNTSIETSFSPLWYSCIYSNSSCQFFKTSYFDL